MWDDMEFPYITEWLVISENPRQWIELWKRIPTPTNSYNIRMNIQNSIVNNLCSFQIWYGTMIFAVYGPAGVILKLKPVFGGWPLVVTSQCTTRVGYGGNQTEVTKKTVLRYGQIIRGTQLSGMTTAAALHWIIYVCFSRRLFRVQWKQ